MFVWLFHRISGVLLIFLIGWKIFTGYAASSHLPSLDSAVWLPLHQQPLLDVLLLGLFIYHSLYGLRTILLDVALRGRETLLFWSTTVLGLALWVTLSVLIYA